MEVVKLKDEFVKEAEKVYGFLSKDTRPYLSLIVYEEKKYLIPFRSNLKKGIYSYITSGTEGLDFRSSFILINDNIIDRKISIPKAQYRELVTNSKLIEKLYARYIDVNTFTDFEKEMIRLQERW